MEVTHIGNKEEGRVWHRKPGPGKGLLVTLVRTAQQSKAVRFLHVAFETTGDAFLAGDHHGNIYMFDIGRNRFHLLQKTGQACTALAFNCRRTTEFLVALADYTIKCFDKDTKQMVSWMRGHEGAVSFISVHGSGRSAISTSSDTAQLWDLDTFQRKRKLSVRQSVGIQRVFFLPLSNTILSCFSDDSIFAWESDTLSCQYQLPVPDSGPKISYRAFAVTPDGKSLVAGGRSNLMHLWCLDSHQLVRVIQMPTQVRTVRQLEFLPDRFDRGASQTLGVLSQDGVMRFIDIKSCRLLFHLGSRDSAISTVAISPNGRHMAAIMDNGNINVYSIQSLAQESKKIAVVSGDDGDREVSKRKVRVRSDVTDKSAQRYGRQSQAKIPTGFPVDDKEDEHAAGLSKKRLMPLLKAFGEYPAKYRVFLWRSLLCLPENYAAYGNLTDKGPHSAFLTLHNKYPIKSHKLQRCLQRVLSALAHWAAIFGEVDYLPLVAFPFVKLFQNNPLLCFEMLATVIVNWCQHWFEYFPNPPLNILAMVENVLAHHDRKLLQHLVNCGITSQLYAWPLLETLFSEVLTRDEWLRLFDSVFSNHPAFLLMACVAYITCCRQLLLKSTHKKDFEYLFHHRNTLDVRRMIKEAYRIMDSTPSDIHPKNMLSDFTPLTKGQYPVFNHYPEFLVEYQRRRREKMRLTERLREREELPAQRTHFMQRNAEEEAFYKQEAEERRRAHGEGRLAAGQDLDVRRMELKAQRRRLEQHLLMEQELLDRQGEHEAGMATKRSAEEKSNTDLPHGSRANIQAPEASLSEARWLGWQSDVQEEAEERLDAAQERKRGQVTELQIQALAEEARLADTGRDVVGREWDEVMNARAQLEERRQHQASGEAVRIRQVGGFPHRGSGTPATAAGSRPSGATCPTETGTRPICLNSSSPSASTSTVCRAQLDSSERELLTEVRALRQKLANRAGRGDSCVS